MANQTHKSGGGNGVKVDIDITGYIEEITDGIKAAIHRALIRIGDEIVSYARDLIHNVTGNLRRSLKKRVRENSVTVKTNVEYARYEEEGNSKRPPHPYLRPAVTNNMDEWGNTLLLWAGYRGGTPDFTRGGYHFFTLCTVNLERIVHFPNGKMDRQKPWKSEKWARNSTAFCFWENDSEGSFRNSFCFYRRLTAFSQSNRRRYTRRTMLERLQVRGYAQEIMPNSWMNFKITVT